MPTPAGPETNQYRCNACGRYFNTEAEVSTHETACRAAKLATEQGAQDLAEQDAKVHVPNDADADMLRRGQR